MSRLHTAIASFFLLTAGSIFGTAEKIVSVTTNPAVAGGLAVTDQQYIRASWTQTIEFDNVTVSAWLSGIIHNGAYFPTFGTAYLTSSANERWQTPFQFPDPGTLTRAQKFTLFSGLKLQAGTYYLTLAGANYLGGIWSDTQQNYNSTPILVVAAEASLGQLTAAAPTEVNPSDPPASTFHTVVPNWNRALFEVTGDRTPSYQVCLLYDPGKAVQPGSTVPIKLQLCDNYSQDLSSAALVLHATDIVQTSTETSGPVDDSGNANAGSAFRFDAALGPTGGYIFNLKTTGLATGMYILQFTVTGDSFVYSAPFHIR